MSRKAGPGGLSLSWRKRPDDMRAAPYAALFLRLILAYFFASHLYNKFFTKDGFSGWWHALTDGQHRPVIVPIYVLSVEFGCLIFFILGFKTRWVALYAIPSFIGIIQFWLSIKGYWFTLPGAEFPVMWLCLLVLQIIIGDGAYALTLSRQHVAG